MALTVNLTALFRKDRKRIASRRDAAKIITEMEIVIGLLRDGKPLPLTYRDHKLTGADARECHVFSDWLLVYRVEGGQVTLLRTGTHSHLGLA